MELVKGNPMDELIRSMESTQKRNLLYQAGVKLREIHEPVYGNIPQFISSFLIKTARFTQKAINVLLAEGLNYEDLLSYVADNISKESLEELGITVVHRDYWLNNTLFQDGNITADFMSTTTLEAYMLEKESKGGFYTNKIDILKEFL